jgi:transcriptional regulator with XRE-family HTH domain
MADTAGHPIPAPPGPRLADKIARLVRERGWNQEDFARIANLNRHTVRSILQGQPNDGHRLRNATINACARALGLTVHELDTLPLERLLSRMHGGAAAPGSDAPLTRLYQAATQPELRSWAERNPERAGRFTAEEIEELLSLQGTGGPLTSFGVEHFVDLIERKRKLVEQVHAIAGTEYLGLLEQLVGLIYEKVRPYRDRR